MSVLYLALPHISAALDARASQQLWILDIYPLLLAGLLVPMGALGDRIGQRRLLLVGAGAFAAVSVAAAFSVNANMLVLARAALGVAGASLMPAALALLNAMFTDPHRRRNAIAVWSSAFMAGFAAGPLLSGALLEAFWWGSVFLPAVPAMVVLLAVGPVLLPSCRLSRAGRFDLAGAVLLATGLLMVVHGLKELAHQGWDRTPLAFIAAGAIALVVFALRQHRIEDPLLDLRLLARPAVATALLLLLAGPAVIGGLTLLVSQYLQSVQGFNALQAGALVAPAALGLIATALLAPAAARRFSAGTVIATGLAVGCAGLLMVAHGADAGPVWVVAGLVLLYAGSGPFDALGTDLVVGSAPRSRAGSAGAASETAAELGTGLGIALLGTLGHMVYRIRVEHMLPEELPEGAATSARESVSGAEAAVAVLEQEQAVAVREAAAAAFTSGLHAVAVVGAALVALLAALAFGLLRHV